jgi:hypothetical protein
LSILDRLRGRKKDDLGLEPFPGEAPNMQGPQGEDAFNQFPDFGNPMGTPDQGSFQQGQPPAQYPGVQPSEPQQQSFTPESMGFERVPNNSNSYSQGSAAHQQSLSEINLGKDLEIISAKLDAIKAELDSINQRLKRVERLAEGTGGAHKDAWSY